MKRARGELGRLRQVRNITQLANFLGMTLVELAAQLPSQHRARKHISAATLCGWDKRRPDGQVRLPSRAQLDAMARLVARHLTARYGVTIGAWAEMNSPLKIVAKKLCPKCGRVFEIRRHTDKCRKCKR